MQHNRPRIFIDGYNLSLMEGTGVATYARNLSFACRDLAQEVGILYGYRSRFRNSSPIINEIDFFDPPLAEGRLEHRLVEASRLVPRLTPFVTDQVPVTGDVFAQHFRSRLPYFTSIFNAHDIYERAHYQFRLLRRMSRLRTARPPALMHWTYPVPIRMEGTKNVYTMHDLVPLRMPYTTLDNKRAYLALMKRLVDEADHIVTVSETSKSDIVSLLGCPPEKITNTYQAVNFPASVLERTDEEVADDVEGVFGLKPGGYYLFFGAIEPKKNVGGLVEAYLASRVETPLVIVGKVAWKSDNELRLVRELKSGALQNGQGPTDAPRVRHIQYLPYLLLSSLIRGARATLFPSLYEGFGLPVLESMTLGTAVMTSKLGATAEVAGDASLLVDPYDVRDISEAIRRLDGDPALRADLVARGRQRAEHFSPSRYQERISHLYEKLGIR